MTALSSISQSRPARCPGKNLRWITWPRKASVKVYNRARVEQGGSPRLLLVAMASDIDQQDQSAETDLILGDERLFHEINLLRIEGFAFCFDPKAISRRQSKQDFIELIKMPEGLVYRPVSVEPHPTYGMPAIVAYKVLQAALKKLSDDATGCGFSG